MSMTPRTGEFSQSFDAIPEARGLKRPNRPCDICRRRKSKCVFDHDATRCVLCSLHKQPCTFDENAAPRPKRSRHTADEVQRKAQNRSSISAASPKLTILDQENVSAQDYGDLRGESLLKTTLGLQNHRHAIHIGSSAEYDRDLLSHWQYDHKRREYNHNNGLSFRKVDEHTYFCQRKDTQSLDVAQEMQFLDNIESTVAPHGEALIRLYFRIVHPSFPILHKKVSRYSISR